MPLSVRIGVQIVGDCFDQRFQERHGGRTIGLVMKLDEGELRGAIDPDIEVKLAFLGTDLSDLRLVQCGTHKFC